MPSFARMPSIHIRPLTSIVIPLQNAISRLDFSLNPSLSLKRLRHYPLTWHGEGQYLFLGLLALFNLIIAVNPPLFGKLFIVAAYTTGVLVPLTSQFVLPATPIFSWLLLFWSSRWTQAAAHPHIWVSVLPTLESVLYGANISDILTRYTSSTLDILAWMPYGLFHFTFPFITAALIWIFGPPGAIKFFAKVFGYMNLLGVMIQITFPCAPPWYELLYGQTPADYSMRGSPGGLARIDALFHNLAYTTTFTNSPMVFGAFPSLHAGCATTDAILLNHFFPRFRLVYTLYVLWLYWSTMYLTHHYLIDLVAGASLAVGVFYLFLNQDPYMRDFALYSPTSPYSGSRITNSRPTMNGNSTIHGKGDVENGYTFPKSTSGGTVANTGGAEDIELPLRRNSISSHSNTASTSSSKDSAEGLGDSAPPVYSTVTSSNDNAGNAASMNGNKTVSPRLHGSRSNISGVISNSQLGVKDNLSGFRDASPGTRQVPFLNATNVAVEGMSRPRTPKPAMDSR